MGEPDLLHGMAEDLAEIGSTRIPFGKYGPANFPSAGVFLYDLPVEYLAWFARTGSFPKGRLGELLRMVHQMKVDGADLAFEPFRRARGRTQLRTPNRAPARRFPQEE
jgi:uncharacterized protein (DUF3820 family)